MFLLCVCDVKGFWDSEQLAWPGNLYTNRVCGAWFDNIKGSRAFYYLLFCEYKR
jgi:hypothetical protein